jgi:Mce-associated membrane protein
MADNSRPRRPVVGSRTTTSRPRRVAGRASEPVEDTAVGSAPAESDSEVARVVWSPTEEARPRGASRVTLALVAAIVLLVGVAAGESWYLWLRDDPVVSADRPVVTSEVATASAVDSAAKALKEVVATSWKDYAQQTEDATKLMTSEFAVEYRKTAEAVQADIVAGKTEVKVEVTHQGVVDASEEQVRALVFLTEYVTQHGKNLTLTPYRALVTVVNTDQGWLVSKIETQ